MTAPLRMSFEVDCSAEHAFAVWTSGIGTWWPADHTVTGEDGLDVVMQSGWERLGAAAGRWRDQNQAGWGSVLPHYQAAIAQGEQGESNHVSDQGHPLPDQSAGRR
jgi:hypothetical protein